MKILILEDEESKKDKIVEVITATYESGGHGSSCKVVIRDNYACFLKSVSSEKYDLIVVDLVVPDYKNSTSTQNVAPRLLSDLRDENDGSLANINTPVIAVTRHDDVADIEIKNLNSRSIFLITYSDDNDSWRESLSSLLRRIVVRPEFDFVIFCALRKEADAYSEIGLDVSASIIYEGVSYRTLKIGVLSGCIVTPPRMGLVNMAIDCAKAIEYFSPKVVCMSGICAGIKDKADIYTTIVAQSCVQHDFGKWESDVFRAETYMIQLNATLEARIRGVVDNPQFLNHLKNGISPDELELPGHGKPFAPKVLVGTASSGSAVVADSGKAKELNSIHRRLLGFEMEVYALYEAARLSSKEPKFFSAKTVVDNGDEEKSDIYHRVACLLSAKVAVAILEEIGPALQ